MYKYTRHSITYFEMRAFVIAMLGDSIRVVIEDYLMFGELHLLLLFVW